MKMTYALALALVNTHAAAQSSSTLMPEGSTDIAVGVLLGSAPKAEGNARRNTFLVPNFWVQWSNGIFLEGLNLGMYLSDDPHLQYGPLLSLSLGSTRADMTGERAKKRFVPGAFMRYQPLYNLTLESTFEYGSAPDGAGFLLDTRLVYGMNIASHHSVSLAASLTLGSSAYMQSAFGVTPQQAAQSGLTPFDAAGGIKSVSAGARWRWQVSRKYTLGTGISFTRLHGSAVASPITSTPDGVSYTTSLTYRF